MPRKKKIDAESIQEQETSNEEKQKDSSELNSDEKELEEIENKKREKKQATEKEEKEETDEEKHKKKEVKMLSEKELKKVMTDTKETIVPLTDYIRCSVHLGTKVITPDMRKFVYKRRADGLAVINTSMVDDKLREACKFFNNFAPEDVFIVCKREAGWRPVEKFSEVLGIRKFTKKYPAGIITNIRLDDFFEAKLIVICDPWVDKNALNDANNLGLPVLAICDTNNYAKGVSNVIAANNKSEKSVGLILYVLAREYLKANGREAEAKKLKLEDFTGKLDDNIHTKEASAEKVEFGV